MKAESGDNARFIHPRSAHYKSGWSVIVRGHANLSTYFSKTRANVILFLFLGPFNSSITEKNNYTDAFDPRTPINRGRPKRTRRRYFFYNPVSLNYPIKLEETCVWTL